MMNAPRSKPAESAKSIIPAIAFFAWFIAGAGLLELFFAYDWDQGLARGMLLIAVAALGGIPALAIALAPRQPWLGYAPLRGLGVLAAICVVLGFGYHLREGTRTLKMSFEQKQVWLDQGENTIRAIRLLLHGVNPYGKRTMLDPVYYRIALAELSAKPFCAATPTSTTALQDLSNRYWQDPVAQLAEMNQLFPQITDRPECQGIRRDFDSMGYKYGPLLLAVYFPFVVTLGEAGIYAAHLVLFAALSFLFGFIAFQMARGDLFLASLPFIILYGPGHIRWNTLYLSAVDLAPTFLALLALWLISRSPQANRAGNAILGLSIGTKMAPGIFFLPLLSRFRSRDWTSLMIVLVVVAAPFLVWDATGYLENWLVFIFARVPDSTSPMYFLGPIGAFVAKTVVLIGLAALSVYGHVRRWPAELALAFVTLAHLGAMGLSAAFHNNYLVWVAPLLGLWMLHTTVCAIGVNQNDNDQPLLAEASRSQGERG
jgi:hypothetical protein